MDLSRLNWTKNIKDPRNNVWAYEPYRNRTVSMELPEAKIFGLAWKSKYDKNAQKPQKSECIILHQRAKITHIAEFLDNQVYTFEDSNEWVYRLVRAIWVPLNPNWDLLPHQKELFGFKIHIQDGLAHNLKGTGMKQFHEYWHDERGGLDAFQKTLASKLTEINN